MSFRCTYSYICFLLQLRFVLVCTYAGRLQMGECSGLGVSPVSPSEFFKSESVQAAASLVSARRGGHEATQQQVVAALQPLQQQHEGFLKTMEFEVTEVRQRNLCALRSPQMQLLLLAFVSCAPSPLLVKVPLRNLPFRLGLLSPFMCLVCSCIFTREYIYSFLCGLSRVLFWPRWATTSCSRMWRWTL